MDESVASGPCDVSAGNSILYELLVYSEWKQDPELPKRPPETEEGFGSILKSALSLHRHDARPEHVERLLSFQQPWRLCVGDGGKVVAIIQDTSLEIRSSRDEYSSVIAKASLPKDPFPQWRRWCWSPDCTMLAVGFSNGTVRVYDLMGCNLFSIAPPGQQQEQSFSNTSSSFASCFFLQARTSSQKWSSELVTVDYKGQLHSYLVSPTEGFQENHSFSFSTFFHLGITAVGYHPVHSLLFVAGPVTSKANLQLQESGEKIGLTAWRIINDHPFYQIVHHDKKGEGSSFSESLWKIPFFSSKQQQSVLVRLEVSPSAKRIAALHSCGGVSVWSLPGIRLQGFWPLTEQPDWNIQNPLTLDAESPNGKRSPSIRQLSNESFYPVDLDWWSDEALVLVRNSGAVSVCEVVNLQNLLGESPEFLAGSPQVRRFHNEKGFLALECDVDVFSKSRNNEESLELQENSLLDASDDEGEGEAPITIFQRVTTILNSVAYLVTDMERFRPRRKKLRLCRRTYRLLALRSTTPEELYFRKLDNEEYGEALNLANTYNLDCDLVYQRQWRNNKVSVATIRDYLSKVSNQTWVLRECLDRVPESLLAARDLIDFGLKATSKEAFRNFGGKRKIKDIEDITDKQKEFILFRQTLLRYHDRLTMYEKILGGLQLADELFEHSVYADFRSSSSLRACVQFARAANGRAVECMLTYQGSQTLHHWLPILSNFPETVCPMEYKSLLPELTAEGVVFSWQGSQLRELDWSEKDVYGAVKGPEMDTPDMDNKWLYEHEPGLSTYRVPVKELTPTLIQQWYLERIRAIERSSRMVDNALILLRLAQDNNIQGLGNLLQELQVLDALVYELFLEDISLADLEKKSPLEKCKLLMSKTSEDSFLCDMNRLLLPYLDRVEKEHPGMKLHLLHDYIISVSGESLALPLKFFEGQEEVSCGLSPDELSTIAVDSIYSYVNTDDLHLAQGILAAIPVQRVLSVSHTEQLDMLELELAASLALHRNGIPKSLGYIRDNKHDVQTVTQLLTRLSRTVANSSPTPSEAVWSVLLNDMLDLQRSVFNCVPPQTCFEVFCSTLLASGNMASIKLAGNYFNCSTSTKNELYLGSESQISTDKCIELVLSAAREYMDSAGSLTDPAMDLARACLHLLSVENEYIQEERNLLSAFQLLHEFGIKMLPIQVRLCPDKLRLIEDCLKKKSGAHRNPSKLLQLAAHLSICNDDPSERQGRVLVLVAEAAYLTNDFRSCAETCNRLVTANYTSGWAITSKLAKTAQFKDLSMRAHLLSFALQHCPPDVLQELVDIRRSLEIESLQDVVKKQIVMHNSSLSIHLEGQSSNTQDVDILPSLPMGESSVQETTQRLLNRIGDTQFWKKALRIGWDESIEKNEAEVAKSHEYHTGHAFYSSLYDSTAFHASKLGCSYDCFSSPDIPPQLQLEQAILRMSLLEHDPGSDNSNLTNVLSECALSLLHEDNCLGLVYLLSLPEAYAKEASYKVFESNLSSVSLQLAQYHAALRWYKNMVNGDGEKMYNLFLYKPLEVISLAAQTHCEDKTWQNELLSWRTQLADYVQAQDLLTLDCGVDVNRFATDEQYRHDTILGLAMNEDTEKLRFALALSGRHGVERGQVIAEHVSHLLLSDLSYIDLQKRLSGPELGSMLSEASEEVKEKLEVSVLPNIDGKEINLLELYFTVLNQVAPSHRSTRLLPKDHLKLLSKIKATTAAIDYKMLISGPKNTIKAVETSLSPDNIPLIAKLLKAMPGALASPMSASQLYAVYVKHQLKTSNNLSAGELAPLLVNIKAKDVVEVIESVFFCDTSSISLVLAEELIAAALLNCDFSESDDCMALLASWKDHVRSSRWLIESWPDEVCCKDFLATNGDKDSLIHLLHNAFLNEEKSTNLVSDLLKSISTVSRVSEDSLMLDTFRNCVNSFQEKDSDSSELSSAILRVEQFAALGKMLGNKDDWEALLRPLATEDKLPPEQRLKIFNILQKTTNETDQEPTLLLSHTQTILASSWPQASLGNKDLLDEESRTELLLHLIQKTESWQQRDALRNILDLWPAFSSNCDSTTKVFYQLLLNCVLCENGKWTEQKASYLTDVCNRQQMPYSELERFLTEAQSKPEEHVDEGDETEDEDMESPVDVQLLILVCLLHDDLKAHRKVISLAQQQLMVPFHERVAELALARGLTVDLLSTPAYSDLISGVLITNPSSVGSIVKTLLQRKHIPEAGSVILRSLNSVPSFMRTFSASIVVGLGHISGPVTPSKGIKSEEKVVSAGVESQTVTASAQTSHVESEWDVAENDWSDVEEPEDIHSSKTSSRQVGNEQHQGSVQTDQQPKSDDWGAQDGWDNWSEGETEEELEKIDAEKASPERFNQEEGFQTKTKRISPPLMPSPQSAFARVPPRDQMQVREDQEQDQTSPEGSKPEPVPESDWDEDDWGAGWEN